MWGQVGPVEQLDPLLTALCGCVSLSSKLWHWWFLAQGSTNRVPPQNTVMLLAWISFVRKLEPPRAEVLWQTAPKRIVSEFLLDPEV